MATAAKTNVITVKLDDELNSKMDQYVENYGADKSKVVRKALESFFKSKSPIDTKSATKKAG